MAVSFCNHSLLTPPRPSSSFSVKPSKILQPKPLLPLRSLHHRPRLSNPIIGFPLSNSSPLSNYYSQSRSFKAYLAAEDSALTVCMQSVFLNFLIYACSIFIEFLLHLFFTIILADMSLYILNFLC